MSNTTTARTVTNAVRKALRLAGQLDRVSSVRTQANLHNDHSTGRMVQVPVWSTVVETVGTETDAVAEVLTAAGFGVTHSSRVPGLQSYVSIHTPRVVEAVTAAEQEDADVALLVAAGAREVAPEPMVISELRATGRTTVAELVETFRHEGTKARRAQFGGAYESVSATMVARMDIANVLVDAGLRLLMQSLFAEQQDLLALHPRSGATPDDRTAAQERLSVVRRTITAILAYPVAKTAQRAA